MATRITFTDSIGAAVLTNGLPFPGDRFSEWTPITRPVGDFTERLSDGAIAGMLYRWNYGASFALKKIPVRSVSGSRLVTIADRLIAHLLIGGTCNIETGDTQNSTYAAVGLLPESEPSLDPEDEAQLFYTLSLSVLNRAEVRMVCHYDP